MVLRQHFPQACTGQRGDLQSPEKPAPDGLFTATTEFRTCGHRKDAPRSSPGTPGAAGRFPHGKPQARRGAKRRATGRTGRQESSVSLCGLRVSVVGVFPIRDRGRCPDPGTGDRSNRTLGVMSCPTASRSWGTRCWAGCITSTDWKRPPRNGLSLGLSDNRTTNPEWIKVCLGLGKTGVERPSTADSEFPGFDSSVFDRPISSIPDPIFVLDQPGWSF